MQYTPGPWNASGINIRSKKGFIAYCDISSDEAKENAVLIAAAPNLLEVCKTVSEFDFSFDPRDQKNAAYRDEVKDMVMKATEEFGKIAKVGTEFATVVAAPLLFAPGFIAGGTSKALDKETSIGERVLGGIEAGLGLTIVGERAVSFAKTPITITKPKRPSPEPLSIEVQKEITDKGKQKVVSTFFRATETRPPIDAPGSRNTNMPLPILK